MLLKEMIGTSTYINSSIGSLDININGIAFDSRDVMKNFVFVCIKGEKADGHDYIDKAIENGAAAIVVEDKKYLPVGDNCITYIYFQDTRFFLSLISSNFYNNPSKKLKVIGITGTNGKTTSAFMVSSILKACSIDHSVISTVENRVLDTVLPPSNTTPESLIIQGILAETVERGGKYSVVECSSHGIEMKRLAHVFLDYAGYTNITHDHIDKHGSMDNYFNIKKALLNNLKGDDGWLVAVNNDDEYISTITQNTLHYGIKNTSPIMATSIVLSKYYSTFTLITPEKEVDLKLPTPGIHNVYNALTAATIAYMDGISVDKIKEGLEAFKNVSGRMDFVENTLGINVVVDFAHNPGGLQNILLTAKDLYGGDIVSVFGVGLYNDPDKYNLMGIIANTHCKMSILTTDSADYFDPLPLLKKISVPMDNDKFIIEVDRYKAIELGFSHCKPGDTLMILGKGHETYIKINGKKIPFNDALVAREIAMSIENENNKDK